jgi:hypothetical protein
VTVQPARLLLYHHKERAWADYLIEYSGVGELISAGTVEHEVLSMPQQNAHAAFAGLAPEIRQLLFFAKPDLIVCMDDGVRPTFPVFALDVTEHVPARDHWIQRFPNLIACAEYGVPGAFVAPGEMPDREKFAGREDPFFFFAYDRVMDIHATPLYIAEWASGDGRSLDRDVKYGDLPPHDSPGMANVLAFFNLVLDAAIKGRNLAEVRSTRLVLDLRVDVRRRGYVKIPTPADFSRVAGTMSRAEFESWLSDRDLGFPTSIPDRISKRDKFLVFSPQRAAEVDREAFRTTFAKRIKEKGGDPYTQLPLVFDYLFCRTGPSPRQRDVNLVVDLTALDFIDFAGYVSSAWKKSPLREVDVAKIKARTDTYTLHLTEGVHQELKNFVRLYAYAADVIVFDDVVVPFV